VTGNSYNADTGTPNTVTYSYIDPATGCENSCTFDVTVYAVPEITGLSEVCINYTTQLSGSGTPSAMEPWTSLDENIATVSDDGLVTAVSSGMVMIIYTDENGCSVSLELTVLSSQDCEPPAPCAEIIFVNAAFLAADPHQSIFHAAMKLMSDGIITSGEDIQFKAGEEVELLPGFEVQMGAILTVDIMDCIMSGTSNVRKDSH
jgi:hypothetical protein